MPRNLRRLRKINSNSNDNCLICFQTLFNTSKLGILPCGHHQYCYQCIKFWSLSSNTCPLCKQRFNILQAITKRGAQITKQSNPQIIEDKDFQTTQIHWEFQIRCQVCGSDMDDQIMLLCDGCDKGFHTVCIGIQDLPRIEFWYCNECLYLKSREECREVWRAMRQVGLPMTPHRKSELFEILQGVEDDDEFEEIAAEFERGEIFL